MSANPNDKIQVLLLDQHALVRHGLRLMLVDHPGIEVIGEAGTSEKALDLVKKLEPDILLLELNLDGELNSEIITELMTESPQVKIILVTAIDDRNILHMAVQMGVIGVVPKTENKDTLIKAIHKVHAGEVWIDRSMMARVLTDISRDRLKEEDPDTIRIASLSEREREVIGLVGQGLKNKEIGNRLSISEVTVRHHLTSIYSKLDVGDRLELTIFAYKNGLAELPM